MSEAAIKEGQEGPFNGYLLTPYNGIVPFLYVRMSSAHTATQRNAWYCLGQRRNGRAVRIYPPAKATQWTSSGARIGTLGQERVPPTTGDT